MGRLFGTDGVRGIANESLTASLAYRLGRAGAYVLTGEGARSPRILVGMDTRRSGDLLESALVAGICSVGAHAVLAGVIPTPAVAHLVRRYGLDAGVVISASHNPMEYNGIKFFDRNGYKLPDALEDRIEELLNDETALPSPVGAAVGTKIRCDEAVNDYISFLCGSTKARFEGIKVALDCANGASYVAAPRTFDALGAKVRVIHNTPNGININDRCGSTHIEGLKKFVVDSGADIGFAFDGDADRCLAVDERGELLDGDKILAICGLYMKEQGKLEKNTIVGTVMTNLGLMMMGKEHGISVLQTNVGDRYVLEKMKEGGYNVGGGQSGHIIFLDQNTTGDGVLTAVQLLTVMKEKGKKASELSAVMQSMPQVLVNAKVNNAKKEHYMEVAEIREAIAALQEEFRQDGRVLIRTSGTEPLVRVMIEGRDLAHMQRRAEDLAKLMENYLQ